jgi:hypothetical protein
LQYLFRNTRIGNEQMVLFEHFSSQEAYQILISQSLLKPNDYHQPCEATATGDFVYRDTGIIRIFIALKKYGSYLHPLRGISSFPYLLCPEKAPS